MIVSDGWLDTADRYEILGGAPMTIRRCLVIHFTNGASARSSIDAMRDRGLSCHLVIDRDGTIYQTRSFHRTCSHAGVSRWKDPNNGILHEGANAFSIGIELANAGEEEGLAKKWSKLPLFTGRHRNERAARNWEQYPEAQYLACRDIAKVLVEKYHLDDVTGHDCIAPERKIDPGPAFPMRELRDACGFGKTLPEVHWL